MSLLRRAGSEVARLLGHDSAALRALRPAWDAILGLVYGRRGIPQHLNGREYFRIDPRHRSAFPEVYDPSVLAYLRERVRPGAVCLNVGAHVGIYTLCLATWAGRRGIVHAFEPNPDARRVLERHISLNGLDDRIVVVGAAVGERGGTADFVAAGAEGTSRLGAPGPSTGRGRVLNVPVVTIDDYCESRHLEPDWITLDIEGWELAALAGGATTIARRQRRIGLVVELHPNAWSDTGWDARRARGLLAELGLAAVPLTGQRDPFAEYGIVALEPATGDAA